MAANTAYADFPRLAALQAADGYLPRQLTYRGSRLVFSRGIVVLAVVASLLIVVFDASVTGLIPLYAIGVFLSFTLSQAGMAHRWWKTGRLAPGQEVRERGSVLRPDPRWRLKMVVNGVGAVITGVVAAHLRGHQVHERRLGRADRHPGARRWPSSRSTATTVTLGRQLSLEHFGPPARVDRHRVDPGRERRPPRDASPGCTTRARSRRT